MGIYTYDDMRYILGKLGFELVRTRKHETRGKMKEIRLTNKVTKTFQGNSRGFGLIEVMVALALLGIIAVAFLGGLATASKAMIIADERATAESLARSQMEYVKNQVYYNAPWTYVVSTTPITPPWGGSSRALSTDYAGYTANVTASPLHATDKDIQKITVTVYHNGKPIVTSGNCTLEGYKVNR